MSTSTPSPDLAQRIGRFAREAEQATAAGNAAHAARCWQQVLQLAPGQVQAMTRLAQCQLELGDPDAARATLDRALADNPRHAMAHALKARIHVAEGDADRAIESLDAAIRHDPGAWAALFEKARLMEAAGRKREAALSWTTGLRALPPDAARAPRLQPTLQHARAAALAGQRELRDFLESRTADLRAQERPRDVERFEHCLDIATGKRTYYTAQPTNLAMPGLPAIQFFHREDFDWAPAVEAATPAILAELEAVSSGDRAGFEPYVQTRPGEAAGQFEALDSNLDWGAYFLWKHGSRVDAHCARCPATVAAVEQAPMVHVRARAPAVLFSELKPGTHIPPHHGATNTRLTVHLPLIVPEGCAFRVGDDTRPWVPGELFIFDDTILHEAWNRGTSRRVVLIFDIWHPMLSAVERELVTRTVEGLVEFYDDAVELGEL
ncbi:MAG TPA: aspartyl/asparaginyl beta-hydroxylase domain-containing protein [Xanthomonadaceae bacterium]|nr:aspartyl/asparaginyl beta-hydroxylase domain-containing protein [Xanthomonadaceae bacterium]